MTVEWLSFSEALFFGFYVSIVTNELNFALEILQNRRYYTASRMQENALLHFPRFSPLISAFFFWEKHCSPDAGIEVARAPLVSAVGRVGHLRIFLPQMICIIETHELKR
mgnify:FL=1